MILDTLGTARIHSESLKQRYQGLYMYIHHNYLSTFEEQGQNLRKCTDAELKFNNSFCLWSLSSSDRTTNATSEQPIGKALARASNGWRLRHPRSPIPCNEGMHH